MDALLVSRAFGALLVAVGAAFLAHHRRARRLLAEGGAFELGGGVHGLALGAALLLGLLPRG